MHGDDYLMASTSTWKGYWEQRGWGRQAMHEVVLRFGDGAVRGVGVDCVGRFTFGGTCDAQGAVVMVKQYLGKHQVLYEGQFDGEGTIFGRWSIWPFDSGEFVLTVERERPADAEIEEIVPAAAPRHSPSLGSRRTSRADARAFSRMVREANAEFLKQLCERTMKGG
jgi:hypothetical protein